MKKAAVTGGAGFIGRHLVERLLSLDYQVTVIDDLSTGDLEALLALVPEHDQPGILNIYPMVNVAKSRLPEVKFDVLYHLAAPVSVPESLEDPDKYYDGIIEGSKRVFQWAQLMGCKTIVAASTAAVYGDPDYVPMDENHPKRPLSPYAEYKLEMEEIMAEWHEDGIANFTALRFFNVYGEGQRASGGYASAVPIFLAQYEAFQPITVTGDGQQTRDWVYVGDVVTAMLLVAAAPRTTKMRVYNVGTGQETQVIELAEALGGEIKFIQARQEPARSVADSSLIREELNWNPETNLIEWVKRIK